MSNLVWLSEGKWMFEQPSCRWVVGILQPDHIHKVFHKVTGLRQSNLQGNAANCGECIASYELLLITPRYIIAFGITYKPRTGIDTWSPRLLVAIEKCAMDGRQ